MSTVHCRNLFFGVTVYLCVCVHACVFGGEKRK